MNAIEIAKEYFPDFDEKKINNIIHMLTGYPMFWVDNEKTPEENFRFQLQEAFNAYEAGEDPLFEYQNKLIFELEKIRKGFK